MEKRSTPPDEKQEVLTPPDNEKENIPSDGRSSLPADSFRLSHPLEIIHYNKPSGILKDAKPPTTAESISVLKSDENLSVDQDLPYWKTAKIKPNYDPMTSAIYSRLPSFSEISKQQQESLAALPRLKTDTGNNTSISEAPFAPELNKQLKTGVTPQSLESTNDGDKKQSKANSNKSAPEKKFEQFHKTSVRYCGTSKHQDSSEEESDFEWLPFPNPFRKRTEEDLRTRRYFCSRGNGGLDDPQNFQLPGSLNVNDSAVGLFEKAKTVLFPIDSTGLVDAAISKKSDLLPDAVPTMNRSVDDPQNFDLPGSVNKEDSDAGLLDEASNILHRIDTENGVISMESVIFPDALPVDHWLYDPRNVDLSAWLKEDDSGVELLDATTNVSISIDAVDEESTVLSEEEHDFVFQEGLPKMDSWVDDPLNVDPPGLLNKEDSDAGLLNETSNILHPIDTEDGVMAMESVFFPDALPVEHWLYDPRDVDVSAWLKEDDSDVELIDETTNVPLSMDTVDEESAVLSEEEHDFVFPEGLPKMDGWVDDPLKFDLPGSIKGDVPDVELLQEAQIDLLPIDAADSDGLVLSMGTEKLDLMDELLDEALHK